VRLQAGALLMQVMVLILYIAFVRQSRAQRAAAKKNNATQLPLLADHQLTLQIPGQGAMPNVPVATVVMPAPAAPPVATQSAPALSLPPSYPSMHDANGRSPPVAGHGAKSAPQLQTKAAPQDTMNSTMDTGAGAAKSLWGRSTPPVDAPPHVALNAGALLLAQKMVPVFNGSSISRQAERKCFPS
jgi:hypothetical protein